MIAYSILQENKTITDVPSCVVRQYSDPHPQTSSSEDSILHSLLDLVSTGVKLASKNTSPSLPPNMVATNLSWSEVQLHCWD